MYKRLLALVLAISLFAGCDKGENETKPADRSMMEVIVYSYIAPDYSQRIVASLPDGSANKLIMTIPEPRADFLTNPSIGSDGRTLLINCADEYKIYLYDIPTMRNIEKSVMQYPYGNHMYIEKVRFTDDDNELYGFKSGYNNIILILNRETGLISPVYKDDLMKNGEITMTAVQSGFIYAATETTDDKEHCVIKYVDIRGERGRKLLDLPDGAGEGVLYISEATGSDQYIYAYDYMEGNDGETKIRIVLTDTENSFATVLEDSSDPELGYLMNTYNRPALSRDGKTVAYTYFNEETYERAIKVKHYENNGARAGEISFPLHRENNDRPTPSFSMILKDVFDTLPSFEYEDDSNQ